MDSSKQAVTGRDSVIQLEGREEALARLDAILDKHFQGSDLMMLKTHSPDYYEYLFDGFESHVKSRIVRYVPGKNI